MRCRGERLLDQCRRRSRDLCRRSRDLDRSLGLYRDVCDLSLNLDCLSLLDLDCHRSRERSRLLEYINNSPKHSRQLSTRINGGAGGRRAFGRKPVPRPQDQEGVGSVREQYNRTLSARNHSVYSRTHEPKIELALTYHFWLSYYATPVNAAR